MLKTSVDDLKTLFGALGVGEGDTVMVHSSLFTFGRIEDGVAGFHQAFRDLVGPEGTLIVPTFTYSFRRGETFDVAKSPAPARLGAYAEYLRLRPDAVRSPDPLFSKAAEGPRADDLMTRTSAACFGDGSVYGRLFDADILILALGITYSTGLAGFMHIERLAEVDYRREIRFTGVTVGLDGVARDDEAIHFARDEARYPDGRTDREAVGRAMEDAGVATALRYGSGRHVGVRALGFRDFVGDALARDPHVMFRTKQLEDA